MSTTDQNFSLPSAGQADWDGDLNSNFSIVARGYHVLGQAGTDIKTGHAVTIGSGGFYFPLDPNSSYNQAHAFAYKSVGSGEEDTFLLQGIVRSLAILSTAVPGEAVFASVATPGVVVGSFSGANRPLGFGIQQDGIIFEPQRQIFPEVLVRSAEILAVTGSLHHFTMDGGQGGFFRKIIMAGDSGDQVEVQFWSNSSRTDLLFQTTSGGVNVISVFNDTGGSAFFNSDVSTVNGLIYGTLQVLSIAAVASDTVGIQARFERFR